MTVYCQLQTRQFDGKTYRVCVGWIQVVGINSTNAVGITLGIIEEGLLHQTGHFRSNQVTKLLKTDDETGPNEATPVGIPAVIDLLWICCSPNSGLFWFFFIVPIPNSRQSIFSRNETLKRRTIDL